MQRDKFFTTKLLLCFLAIFFMTNSIYAAFDPNYDYILIDFDLEYSWSRHYNSSNEYYCQITSYTWDLLAPTCDNEFEDDHIRKWWVNRYAYCWGGWTADFEGGCIPDITGWPTPNTLFTSDFYVYEKVPKIRKQDPKPEDETCATSCCDSKNEKEQKSKVTNPIDILTGEKEEKAVDIAFNTPFEKGFHILRTYNSKRTNDSTIGYGWHHNYLVELEYISPTNLYLIKDESNNMRVFRDEDGDGTFIPDITAIGTLTSQPDGSFVWHRGNGIDYTFNDQHQFVTKTDGNGNVQSLTYDSVGRLETITDDSTDRTITFVYNVEGKIDHIQGPVTDAVPDGIWVSYDYDGNNNLTFVTYADDNNGSNSSGSEYRYEDSYDVNNLTTKLNLAGEVLSSYLYDSNDMAYQSTTRDGRGVSIAYPYQYQPGDIVVTDDHGVQKTYTTQKADGYMRISSITGDNGCSSCGGNIVRYGYDGQRINEIEYANGRIDRFEDFNPRDQYQTEILAAGTPDERTIYYTLHPITGEYLTITEASVLGTGDKVTIFDYDDDGNAAPNENPTRLMRRKIEQGFTYDSTGQVVAYEYITTLDYNAKGQVLWIDGPLAGDQDRISFAYDPVTGDLTSQTLPLAGTTSFTYDGAGNVETITDLNSVVTTIAYDGRNRPVSITRNGVTTAVDYTAAGEVDSVTDALNRVLDYVYNPAGFLERVIDPKGNYTFADYNTLGQIIESSIYGADNTQTFYSGIDYGDPVNNPDLLSGKPWKSIRRNHDDTVDLETVYAYNAMGGIKGVTDAETNATTYDHDLYHRLAQVTQPGAAVTAYDYDLHGNLISVTDAENHATLYLYDDMGRLVQTDSPDTGITTYAYDEAGNLRYRTLNGKTTEYRYDVLSRLTNILYTDAALNVTMTYDSGAGGANLNGRLASVTDPSGFVEYSYDDDGNVEMETRTVNAVAFVTGYGYDDAGNLRSVTYPTGHSIAFEPDAVDPALVQAVTLDSAALASDIAYAPFGPVTAMTLANGIQVTRTYDKNYQVRTLAAPTVLDRTYTPDAVGNIELITDNLDSTRSQSFGYDALYRLTNANGIYGAIDFTYDKAGNRTSRIRTGATPSDDSYYYVPGTNLLQAVVGTHPELIKYDADGNTTARTPAAGYTVPPITDPADYLYNSGGRRQMKQNSSNRIFHYDLAGQLIAETDGLGNLVKGYVWLHGQPLAQFDAAGNVSYYHNDHLGTPQRMTNASGTVVWAADYLPFGQAEVTVETVGNDLRFAGQYYDAETGLHYNYHRYYDPKLGRYLRADPIGLAGGINPYIYVDNNPVNFFDPFGLERKRGKTPPTRWPQPPRDVVGKKPKWNPEGYWEGKGRRVTWDDRSHGAGIDRGDGPQGGHWDDETSDNRWDEDGNLLPGSADLSPQDNTNNTCSSNSNLKRTVIVVGTGVVIVYTASKIASCVLSLGMFCPDA